MPGPAVRAPLDERLLLRYARLTLRRAMDGFAPPHRLPTAPPYPILLYTHVPFCEQPCVYCSFHRVAFREDVATRYYHALREEMRQYADRGYRFDGLSVGGGTPTVLPRELHRTIELARRLWPLREVTVETNPSHLGPENVALLRDAGVGRLSVGVQSLRDDVLVTLGRWRYGSTAEIRAVLERVRGVFPSLNVDMIFGYPGQTAEDLAAEVRELLTMGLDQITYYPLMYSRATRKALRRRMGGAPVAYLRDLYDVIRGELPRAYRPTSAWCFARRSGHALDEYIAGRGEYAGLGSGSFGLIGGTFWATTFSIPGYIEAVLRGASALAMARPLSPLEHAHYTVLMGLFSGSPRVRDMLRQGPPAAMPAILLLTTLFAGGGALVWSRAGLAPSRRGAYAAVLLMRELFERVNDFRDACRGL